MSFRCGTVAVIGQPNVGKSTLVNYLVGEKVGIVSNKPQTTRKNLLGIINKSGAQILLVDTPGIHAPKSKLGKIMVDSAVRALAEADAALYVVDISKLPTPEDHEIARMLRDFGFEKVIVARNKMDRLRPEYVEAHYAAYESLTPGAQSIYTNALTGDNLDKLLELIIGVLPQQSPIYTDPEFYTDQSVRSIAEELIREQVLHNTREEVPYGVAVQIESWQEPSLSDNVLRIGAAIVVERESQKPILIGKGGVMLKKIGTAARLEIEKLTGHHVFLELFVKVREHWRDHPTRLRELGILE